MAISRVRSLLSLSKCKCKSKFNFTSSLLHSFSSVTRFSSSTVPSQLERVGFIGLGNMGSRMANNLIKAGYKVTVYDLNHNVMKLFSERGVLTKDLPSEIAKTSDVIITMLPSSTHVLDVYTGPNGLLSSGNRLRPWLFIDSSTIDPQTSRKLSVALSNCALKEKKGQALEEGNRLFKEPFVGGLEEAYLAAKSLFLSMGKSTIYCGGAGNGSAAKICNNLAMAVSMLGVSEAFSLGQSLGISAGTLTKIFNSSSGRCWSSDSYNPVPGVMEGVPSSRNYNGGFASKLMCTKFVFIQFIGHICLWCLQAKDLNIAFAAATEVGVKCPLASHAKKIFTELCNHGHGMEDFSCVFRHYYSGKEEP
ncbi:probable 3-hydroxyisobutyrate dehydrogenase, mitochondrial isoform X2 [Camellia sinensis]|uniref:probable 3-hydroxyisobutyrate dehydrogenase, mitochondrial isoform X2 n=1 Tax=Camellia sinensis TaxID=4442 RepID=UPI001035C859|nr:probable 3-hydroxyisobutyrate dehydrogenase, mitochondrial isoform X2 [Camellia sinensis]